MDDELRDGGGVVVARNSVDSSNSGTCENKKILNGKGVTETVVVIPSVEEGSASENGNRDAKGNPNATANTLESSKDGSKIEDSRDDKQYCVIDMNCCSHGKFGRIMDDKVRDEGGISELQNSVDSRNLRNLTCESVADSMAVIKLAEEGSASVSSEKGNRDTNGNSSAPTLMLEPNMVSTGGSKIKDLDDDKQHCFIDIKDGDDAKFGDNSDGERVCRICHLSSDPSLETPPRARATTATTADAIMIMPLPPPPARVNGLIHLGCGCKDELGMVHAYCAESWFKLKGSRQCEICGETAKNVTGVTDSRFLEEWNESRPAGGGANFSNSSGGCWRGQPFCNFLMSCLVIAFVLPWFLRVNMF
ncbi:hypothetical protein NMG60_11012868 [Bertholletia excelsa]